MAFTQGQLDALDNAIATGTTEITFEGKTVRYRSLDEMIRIRRMAADSIAGTSVRSRSSVVATRKG